MLNTVSILCSFSVLLSAIETSHSIWTALVLACWPLSESICTRACAAQVATFTVWGRCWFEGSNYSRAATIQGSNYSRAATIQGQRLFKGSNYSKAATIWVQRLFKGSNYLRAATIQWQQLFEGNDYSMAATIRRQWLFNGSNYSRAATIQGQQLFTGSIHLKKYGIFNNAISAFMVIYFHCDTQFFLPFLSFPVFPTHTLPSPPPVLPLALILTGPWTPKNWKA